MDHLSDTVLSTLNMQMYIASKITLNIRYYCYSPYDIFSANHTPYNMTLTILLSSKETYFISSAFESAL